MAIRIVLDDGRALNADSVDGLLLLTSAEIGDRHEPLRRWLADKGKRAPLFQNFDIRGLKDDDRAEFWRAATAAADALRARFGDGFAADRASLSASALARLLELKREIDTDEDPEEVYEFDGRSIDLADLWVKAD